MHAKTPYLVGVIGSVVVAFAPASASALTFVQVVGLFYIVVGLLLTFTLGIFITGAGVYFARLNTWPSYRDTAIKVLQWGVLMLFILILLIALVQFIQRHSATALAILGVIFIIGVLIIIARVASSGKKKKPPERGAGSGPPPGIPPRR